MKWPEFRSIWCKGPAIKSSEKTFSTFVHFYCLDKLSRKMAYQCITCKKFVNKRREALLCNGCNSGVSWETYRDAVGSGEDIPWKCESCSASRASLPNFRVRNLRQPKSRSQDGASTEICQLHRGKLDLQHSLAPALELICAINQNKQWYWGLASQPEQKSCWLIGSAPLHVCGPTAQRSETTVATNSSGLWVLAWANVEVHLSWSAEAALQTLGGRQQEGEVTQAAAQRMCQYKQASDALNWTELTTRIFIYCWVE